MCLEDNSLALKDETLKVILNTKGDTTNVGPDLANFMEYVNTGIAKDEFTRMLDAEVVVQRNDDGKAELFMTWDQEQKEAEARGRNEGRKEGLVEGELKKSLEIAHNMKAKGYDLADIIEMTGLTAEQIAQA